MMSKYDKLSKEQLIRLIEAGESLIILKDEKIWLMFEEKKDMLKLIEENEK